MSTLLVTGCFEKSQAFDVVLRHGDFGQMRDNEKDSSQTGQTNHVSSSSTCSNLKARLQVIVAAKPLLPVLYCNHRPVQTDRCGTTPANCTVVDHTLDMVCVTATSRLTVALRCAVINFAH